MTITLVPYDDALARYDPLLGLETHVELSTASKMFCGCATAFGAPPNTQICPTCLGLPGSLPVTNRAAVEHTMRIGLRLGCRIAEWCRFARKNYFYPDMPKDFQISQYDEPLCVDGAIEIELDGTTYRIEIERVHLEEDTGKTTHVGGATGRIHGADYSLGRLQPGGDPAGRDRDAADRRHRHRGRPRRPGLRDRAARPGARARRFGRADGAGQPALRRQRLAVADGVRRRGAPAPRRRT